MTTTLLQDLQSYQDRRRFPNWRPRQPETFVRVASVNDGLIHRCLHFLPLEMQVSDWCYSSGLSADVSAYLLRNAKDEDKHDQVLTMLAEYYSTPQPPQQALDIIDRWHNIDCHPVLAAYTLEMGVFFTILPTLMKHGDVYAATVAQWINDDERCHVETNLRIIRELGLKVTKELARLVYDTVAYIYTANSQQAMRAVDRLLTGRDKQMLNESLPVTIAFFEQQDKRAIVY